MESIGNIESAHKLLKRATNVFFKTNPSIHLHFADFCEQHQLDDVSLIYKNLFKNEKNNLHLESLLHHINFQRRKGNLQLVKHLYSSSINFFKNFDAPPSSNPSSNTSNTTLASSSNSTSPSSSSNLPKNDSSSIIPPGSTVTPSHTSSDQKIGELSSNRTSSKTFSEEITFLVIHFANFLIKVSNSPNEAKRLFEEHLPSSSSLTLFITFLSFLSSFSENDEGIFILPFFTFFFTFFLDYNRILREVYESDILKNNNLCETDKMKFQFNFLNYVRDYSKDISL